MVSHQHVINSFGKKLKHLFHRCILECATEGMLSYSMRKGIIMLIHKGNGLDRDNLSNYRPITLTNTDYKILTKALAIRFQNVIKTIISEDKAGFIKGWNITSHIRLTDDITSYLRKQNAPGALLALDFSKAFDSLRKECIIEALEIFNVGPHFIHLVSTVMNNTESCIHNGGWLSDWFTTEKGIRQGCPLSPLLFVTAVKNPWN